MRELINKNILITGATGGLGKAFTKHLSQIDCNIIITSTSQEKLDNLVNELQSDNCKANFTPIICNFLNKDNISALTNYLKENNIAVDLLINNAGYITEGSIENCSFDTIEKCIKVNCLGTIQITKNILDLHDNSKLLRIITITSLAGDYPMPYMAIYSSTKALLKNYMLAMNNEYKRKNVKCLVVQPGAIPTSDDMKEAIKAQGLKGKLSAVSPNKIAIKSIQKSIKGKKIYIPGFFNKLTSFVSKITPQSLQMNAISSMWKKSQEKRNIK